MEIYNKIEHFLPEMTDIRQEYNNYLKSHKITKTNEEKLCDYCVLIDNTFRWNREQLKYDIKKTDIEAVINSECTDEIRLIEAAHNILSRRVRRKKQNPDDCAEFSDITYQELRSAPDVEGCAYIFQRDARWQYKNFPPSKKLFSNNDDSDEAKIKHIVRYALNVNPGVGLFKKLDKLCLKHNAFCYKVACKQDYDTRVDPVIIYAPEDTKKEMLNDLPQIVRPYRRKDNVEAIGYTDVDGVVFTADEVTKEKVEELICQTPDKEDADKFMRMREIDNSDNYGDCWDEHNMIYDDLYNSGSILKRGIMNHLSLYVDSDFSISCGQFQASKMLADAYRTAKQQDNNAMRYLRLIWQKIRLKDKKTNGAKSVVFLLLMRHRRDFCGTIPHFLKSMSFFRFYVH